MLANARRGCPGSSASLPLSLVNGWNRVVLDLGALTAQLFVTAQTDLSALQSSSSSRSASAASAASADSSAASSSAAALHGSMSSSSSGSKAKSKPAAGAREGGGTLEKEMACGYKWCEALRVFASARVSHIFFADKVYPEQLLPAELRLLAA